MERKINLFRSKPTGDEMFEISEVLSSGWWAMGAKVKEFEESWAKYTGAKYAVATNSCTAALDLAVRVAPLGDTITVSPFTFVSSALCILNCGKKVKFVDIDKNSLCTKKADIQVMYGGNQFGQGIIYDMAHSGGVKHKGLISCWSFHAVKNLPCGDGGMLTTNDPEVYRRAKALSWCGIDKSTFERDTKTYSWDYNIQEVGLKANMNDITASIGISQLSRLDIRNEYRKKIASWYDKYLPKNIKRPYKSSTWHLYTIRVKNRNNLIDLLKKNGIDSGLHYKPLYYYKIFPEADCPVAERVYHEIISLPMHLDLVEDDIKFICDIIKQHE